MTTDREFVPGAVAATLIGDLNMDAREANNAFIGFLGAVAKGCIESGGTMVGHVKANIKSGEEMMSISSTTDDGNVRIRSSFTSHVDGYEMTLNAIVYGISDAEISKVIDENVNMIGNPKLNVLTESCNDPECKDPDCTDQAHRVITIG